MKEALEVSQSHSMAARLSTESYLKGRDVDTLFASDRTDEYRELLGFMAELCWAFDLKYVSVYTVDPARGVRTYRFVANQDGHTEEASSYALHLGATSTRPFSEEELRALDGREPLTYEKVQNQYGYMYSWYYPILRKDGTPYGILDAAYDAGSLMEGVRESALAFATPMIVTLDLFIIVGLILLKKGAIDSLRVVSRRMALYVEDGNRTP